jgi:hypothetical protein
LQIPSRIVGEGGGANQDEDDEGLHRGRQVRDGKEEEASGSETEELSSSDNKSTSGESNLRTRVRRFESFGDF